MPSVGMCRDSDGISSFLKVQITQGDMTVVGYIGDGASKSLSVIWQNPFEDDTVAQAGGGALSKGSDLAQLQSGITSKTIMNTAIIWEGIAPHEVNLPLYFKAYENAKLEVNDAIMYLEKMASPELSETVGLGAVPASCQVNIGRRLILNDCKIKEVSSELDAPKDRNGYMTHNTVQLTISMASATNKSDVSSLYN